MAQSVLHPADSRGHANQGWLDSYHTFSFANYQNPSRIHFGALRVLNDTVEDRLLIGRLLFCGHFGTRYFFLLRLEYSNFFFFLALPVSLSFHDRDHHLARH